MNKQTSKRKQSTRGGKAGAKHAVEPHIEKSFLELQLLPQTAGLFICDSLIDSVLLKVAEQIFIKDTLKKLP